MNKLVVFDICVLVLFAGLLVEAIFKLNEPNVALIAGLLVLNVARTFKDLYRDRRDEALARLIILLDEAVEDDDDGDDEE